MTLFHTMYALWHNKTVPTLYLSESGILRGPSMDRDSDGSSSIYSKNALPLQYKSVKLKCYIKYLISKSVKMLSTRFINKTYTQTSKNYKLKNISAGLWHHYSSMNEPFQRWSFYSWLDNGVMMTSNRYPMFWHHYYPML